MSAILLLVLRILLVVLLYAFLGTAFFVLWQDVKRQGRLLEAQHIPQITLTTASSGLNLSRPFSCAEVILGRDETCDFPLGDQTVSSRHARLSYHQNQWWLEDLSSTNGTFLNEEAVTTPVVLTHGDQVRLGQVGVRISIG